MLCYALLAGTDIEEVFVALSSFFGQVEYTDPSDVNVDRGQYLLLVANDVLRTLSVLLQNLSHCFRVMV